MFKILGYVPKDEVAISPTVKPRSFETAIDQEMDLQILDVFQHHGVWFARVRFEIFGIADEQIMIVPIKKDPLGRYFVTLSEDGRSTFDIYVEPIAIPN
jgi:hypothetical protein